MAATDQRANESMPAYRAFMCYLELGEIRSLATVGHKVGKSTALMERWSVRHSWVARAREFDSAEVKRRFDQMLTERQEMSVRQANVAKLLLIKCAAKVSRLNPDKIGNHSLARLLSEAARIERTARGLPGEDQVASITINVSHRPPEPDAPEVLEFRRKQ